MNNDTVKGKWTELKGEVLNKWGKLTSDELDETKGNLVAIAGLIQQRYGDAKEAISDSLHEMFGTAKEAIENLVENTKEDAGRKAADTTEDVKLDVREAVRGTNNKLN